MTHQGKCLCGKVRFTAATVSKSIGACHCSSCRTWSGGPLLAVDCQQAVAFENETCITRYPSSDWAERGFCNQCGTHLFYRLKEADQYIVPVGLFDDLSDVTFDHQIFIEEKPEYYCFANKTKEMTGEEVFAQYSSGSAHE